MADVTYKGYTQKSDKYKNLKDTLIDIVNGIKRVNDPSATGCDENAMSKLNACANYFSSMDNWMSIIDAYEKWGRFPDRNRQDTGSGRGTIHYCDWLDIYNFYNYAMVSKDFPKLEAKQSNCYVIKSALDSLEQLKANETFGDSSYFEALNKKYTEYTALYSSMACDKYIIDQDKKDSDEAEKLAAAEALRLQKEAFETATGGTSTNKEGKSTNTNKYILYGFVGLAAIGFITVLIMKSRD